MESNSQEVVRTFLGHTIETQRIRVTVEQLSDLTADFVHVFHAHGDDSVTDMLFTDDEARYLLKVLRKLYPRNS